MVPTALVLATLAALALTVAPLRAQDVQPGAPAAISAPATAPTSPGTSPRVVSPATTQAARRAAPGAGAETPASPAPAPEAPSTQAPPAPAAAGPTPPSESVSGGTLAPAAPTAPAPAPGPDAPVAAPVTPTGLGAGPEGAVDEAALQHDLSPWGMFMAADIVVKSVMVGLAFASVVTWTIWLAKALELAAARTRAKRAVRCLERAEDLDEAVRSEKGARWPKQGPVAALAKAASLEIARSDGLDAEGVKERAAVALQRIEARAGRTMSRGTGLLATIGSTAPFVGLFGTVWGIMNSFIGISRANTTNLAVVAPGIAEALLATAIGLVAAIPAVIIYNVFARSIAGYRAVLADASAEILRHLSRDLDRRARRLPAAPAPAALQAAE